MTERERRQQISLRMKAGRYLAGGWGKRGATPLATAIVAGLPAMVDENVSDDRLMAIEQIKPRTRPPARSELLAFIAALRLPPDWFDGLYASDRGDVSTALGAGLQAVAEASRELRQARGATERRRV